MRSATRQKVYLVLFAALVAGLVVTFGLMDARQVARDRGSVRPISPMEALPSGAALLLTADWRLLRKTLLGSAFSGAKRELPEVGPIGELCGFDPSLLIEEVALAVVPAPGKSQEPHFGIAVTGNFGSLAILDCAKNVIARRGGVPKRSELSSFSVVSDERGSGSIAIRSQGPVLISGGDYLESMIKTAEGHASHVGNDELHRILRREIGPGGALALSFILPPDFWTRLMESPEASVEQEFYDDAPVGTIRAVAARVDVEPNPKLAALLACAEPTACHKLGNLLRRLGSKLRPLVVGEFGIDLHKVRISEREQQIRLSLELTQEQAAKATRYVLEWARVQQPDLPRIAPGTWPADELIRP